MMGDNSVAVWFKSSHSGASENCVEVAFLAQRRIGVRDSKDQSGPVLVFTASEWSAFTAAAATGGLDL